MKPFSKGALLLGLFIVSTATAAPDSPLTAARAVNGFLAKTYQRFGDEPAIVTIKGGVSDKGQPCHFVAYGTDRVDEVYVSLYGDEPADSLNFTLFPGSQAHPDDLQVKTLERTETSLTLATTEYFPAGRTDWGWPTLPGYGHFRLELTRGSDGLLTDVKITKGAGVIDQILGGIKEKTCRFGS